MRANGNQRNGHWRAPAQALPLCLLLVCQSSSTAAPPGTAAPGLASGDPDIEEVLAPLTTVVGADYIERRSRLLSERRQQVCDAIGEKLSEVPDASLRLIGTVMVRWCANESQCTSFHDAFKTLLNSSYGTVSGDPSRERIVGGCLRHWRDGNDDELLLLERLLKYDDPPHAKSGIITALGAMGTERSLVPLLELMKSDEHPLYSGICAMAAAQISKRIGDTRVVGDIVTVYGKRPRSRGTGIPEEYLRRMPPYPHLELILALRQLGGEEALRALDELRRKETDPVLIERLDDAKESVRKALEKQGKAQAP